MRALCPNNDGCQVAVLILHYLSSLQKPEPPPPPPPPPPPLVMRLVLPPAGRLVLLAMLILVAATFPLRAPIGQQPARRLP